jgi:hypothetical protein
MSNITEDESICKMCLGVPMGIKDIESLCLEHRKLFIVGNERKLIHDEVIS